MEPYYFCKFRCEWLPYNYSLKGSDGRELITVEGERSKDKFLVDLIEHLAGIDDRIDPRNGYAEEDGAEPGDMMDELEFAVFKGIVGQHNRNMKLGDKNRQLMGMIADIPGAVFEKIMEERREI